MSGPLEGGDVWGPGRVPHGASPPSSGPTTSLAGPLDSMEPEASYQAEAERDAGYLGDISEISRRVERLAISVRRGTAREARATIAELLDALAVAERERDQAREALTRIAYFPFNVMRDARFDLRDVKEIAAAALAGEPDAAP